MWVNREFPDIYTVNLLDEGLYQSYLADISRFVVGPGAGADELAAAAAVRVAAPWRTEPAP